MRLVIISQMYHYRRADGRIVGWGPTVQEIDHLATRFDDVRHIASFMEGEPPASMLPYASDRVKLVPVPFTGGDRLRDKLGVLAAAPGYLAAMLRELRTADVVHVRCPANISLFAAVLLPWLRRPRARWIKYAGNWRPERYGSLPFAFQRWFLATPWHRGMVTVNGSWPGQPPHVRSFYNPSFTDEELAAARASVRDKRMTSPVRLLFAGRLDEDKGVGTALRTLAELGRRGTAATLALAGDGPDRAMYERLVDELGLRERVVFHGWVAKPALAEHYARAHLMLFPTKSEGWPKVISEGMAYGAVPIATAVGAIPQYLESFQLGRALAGAGPGELADAVESYARDPGRWQLESRRAQAEAEKFTFSYYLRAVDELLAEMRRSTGSEQPGFSDEGARSSVRNKR